MKKPGVMTGRERVLTALRGGRPDRTPVMEMAIDWSVMRALGYRNYLDMIRGLDLDGVSVNQLLYVLGWRRWIIPHLTHIVDEWGVRSRFTGDLLPIPVEHPIQEPGDLVKYRIPDPGRSPLIAAVKHVRKRCSDRAVAVVSRNDFAAAWYLCGMDRFLIAMIDDPPFVDTLLDMVNDYYCRLLTLCVNAGADLVYFSDDYAHKTGTLISPDHFERFILPRLARGVEAVHAAGGLCIKHTDGDITAILDLILSTGVDGIGPLEPAAGNDLYALRQRLDRQVALIGNVDVDLLSRGSVDEVEGVARNLVDRLGAGGGYILSSGNTISAAVDAANFEAMVNARTLTRTL